MPTRSKVLGNGTIGGEEALRVPGGLKPLQAPLALAGRLVGVLRAVIEVAVLAMFHPRENLPLRRPVAFELVGDEHAGHVCEPLEEFAEEFLGGLLVAPTLHEDIEDVAVLIHGSPEVMRFAINGQKHLIQVPFVTRSRAPATQLIGVLLAELAAPLPDRFVRDKHATDKQQFFDITVAEAEAVVQPDVMTDNLGGKMMVFVALRSG
jgi:hypothetical protein